MIAPSQNLGLGDTLLVLTVAASVTLLLSVLLPIVIKPLLVRLGIMDVPNARSSHEHPVPRGLGLAVLTAMLGGYLIGILWLPDIGGATISLVTVAGVAMASGLLGLGEDLKGVSVSVRSVLLLSIAIVAAVMFIWVVPGEWALTLPLWGQILLALYGVLFLSSYINVANFMDGLNGISGFHGVIAGLAFAAAGVFSGLGWLAAVGLVLAAGFAGFLPWNLRRPGAFLGDVGSYLLGGAIAVTSFAALLAGVPVLATIGPMIIYFGDVGMTLLHRLRQGKRWDEPHKKHVYQQLQQSGLSHVAASGVNALFTAAAAILGLLSFALEPVGWIALLVAGLGLVALYMRLPKLIVRSRQSRTREN